MNKTMEAALAQSHRDLERHRRESKTERGAGSELACSEWMDALHFASNAIGNVLHCTESMNAHELSLALQETRRLLDAEYQKASASIGRLLRPQTNDD